MIHLPASPHRHSRLGLSVRSRWPIVFATVLSCALILAWNLQINTHLQVRHIEIEGNQRVSDVAIRHLSDIYADSYPWMLSAKQIEHKLVKHPWIRSASVDIDFPNHVSILIEEQSPILLIAAEHFWYLNDEGMIFRRANPDDMDYPVLTGISASLLKEHPRIGQRIINDALVLYETVDIPLLGGQANISEIHFDRIDGFSVLLRNGTEIIFGFYPPEGRMQRLRMMVAKGLSLTSPQRIELDADKIALVTPL